MNSHVLTYSHKIRHLTSAPPHSFPTLCSCHMQAYAFLLDRWRQEAQEAGVASGEAVTLIKGEVSLV